MPIPKYFQMYNSFLRSLSDGQKHAFSDTKNQVIRDFNLSEADLAELLPSGRQSVFTNRIGWCRTYLKKAGLIESPSRAHFIITDAGKRILDTVDEITNDTLRQFPSFVEFVDGEAGDGQVSPSVQNDETPQETLERVYGELNNVLKDELLTRIHQSPSEFFERFVVRLMEKMGYGRGEVTQRTRDAGIDGIMYQDKLGFDRIYIQAKRKDLNTTVGRPDLQRFWGAIPERNTRGLFVTTAKFLPDAKQFVEGGLFVNYDQFCAGQAVLDDWFDSYWESQLAGSGLTEHDIALWKERRKLDRECSVEEETAMLCKSGFKSVKCVYSYQKFSVIIAIK